MRMTARAAALCVGLLVLAGCADEPTPTGSTSSTPSASQGSASPSPSPTASSSPGATSSNGGFALDDLASASFPDVMGPLGTKGAVRIGSHDGYDRVVWQFDDVGPVSYQVRYVEEPIGDGSGDPVEVKGEAYLEVLVTGLSIPESLESCPDDAPASTLKGTVIAAASAFCGGFEGVGQGFVGLDEQRPFRVATLADPTRLVLDIATN